MFTEMKIAVLLFFTICVTIGGTSSSQNVAVYKSHVENLETFIKDEDTKELIRKMPNGRVKDAVYQFYKTDHIENIIIDGKKDIQLIFGNAQN